MLLWFVCVLRVGLRVRVLLLFVVCLLGVVILFVQCGVLGITSGPVV